ncbi:ROK family transcriptional regulator [Phytoactinopolyspora endophytica]|uniref:ROK family transcriptional regulator n=1 Tax=Phytoactinopolyspora endophytica TaxID=1642495 RepID=UPI0013EDC59F|nr:ROK family transcriptional regulator [Phytoactinopolyspora endophytica]
MADANRSALRLLREGHEDRVLGLLRTHGALSRSDLAQATGLSRTALWSIVSRLISIGAVVESDKIDEPQHDDTAAQKRGKGRPPTYLTLNPASGLAIGIDIGHRRIHASIANAAHDIIAATSEACTQSAPWRDRVHQALALVDTLTASHHISLDALEGVGVGVIGPVAESGTVPQSRAGDRAELVHTLVTEHLNVPIFVDNNTRLGALAEAIWGGGRGTENVLYLRLSYGVGGGLVLGGHLFSGAFGAAGEFGHISVEPDGPACGCGGRGCLERYIALPELLKNAGVATVDGLIERLESGDDRIARIVRDAGTRLGRVIAAAANVVNPEVVVVGGELAAAGEALLGPARDAVETYSHGQVRRRLSVVSAELGDEGPALGGVALVLKRSTLLAGYPITAHEPEAVSASPQVADSDTGTA